MVREGLELPAWILVCDDALGEAMQLYWLVVDIVGDITSTAPGSAVTADILHKIPIDSNCLSRFKGGVSCVYYTHFVFL